MDVVNDFLEKHDTVQFDIMQRLVHHRVFAADEKGMRRHGKGLPLWLQPAFQVRPNSPGFFTGQAQKKIIEGSLWEGDEAEGLTPESILAFQMTEYVDAIAYLTFELMYLAKIRLGIRKAADELKKAQKEDGLPLSNSTPEEDWEEEEGYRIES